MNRLDCKYPLEGFIETHLHTAPDARPRILNDIEAAKAAENEKMRAIVIKSHIEPTSGRARIAQEITGFKVIGGVCLNSSVGGLNTETVKTSANIGGKIIWLPTISYGKISLSCDDLEDVLIAVKENDLILATGHLGVEDIFQVLDLAKIMGLEKILINHPLTEVIGASIEEQKEMARHAYLEHCYVACMPRHDGLNPEVMADAIMEVGSKSCIMATDFGQTHNPAPVEGMKMFVASMQGWGVPWKDIKLMCKENPLKLFF